MNNEAYFERLKRDQVRCSQKTHYKEISDLSSIENISRA
jgi:hypothetical protein